MSKKTVLTGITTSGTPHIGNYLGAIKPAIEASEKPELESYFFENRGKTFQLNYFKYAQDIRQSCKKLGVESYGSHGFRWTFAKNRIREYQSHGYSYEQACQGLSWELKHFRSDISEHYLG